MGADIYEDYFLLGGFTSAAIALQATHSISIGIGVVSTVVRHPAVTAMETATLAGAFPGRLQLAFGHGVPSWIHQMDLNPKSILKTMREAITGVRALLNGETYSAEGVVARVGEGLKGAACGRIDAPGAGETGLRSRQSQPEAEK